MLPLNRRTRAAVPCGLARRAAAGSAAAYASRVRALGARVQPDASCVWLDACTCMHARPGGVADGAVGMCRSCALCDTCAYMCVPPPPAGWCRSSWEYLRGCARSCSPPLRKQVEWWVSSGVKRLSPAARTCRGEGGWGDHGLSMRPRPPSSRGLFGG